MNQKNPFLRGKRIDPEPIHPQLKIPELIDQVFCAYNAARLREACHLYAEQMLNEDVTVGMTLSGALSPAGLGISTFVPLIEMGFHCGTCCEANSSVSTTSFIEGRGGKM